MRKGGVMMNQNKNAAMWEYLMQYPALYEYLKFNTTDAEIGESSFSTVQGTAWEKRFVRGHGIKRYDFALAQVRAYDTGTSQVNAAEMFDTEKFMLWIQEQNEAGNFPDFPEQVISIECLDNMPSVAAVSEDGTAAKYMFQCRVRYYE